MPRSPRSRLLLSALCALFLLGACTGAGINAGGETATNNGGVAFIAFTAMLLITGAVLWFFLGRGE